jgi:hypothetical protein
VKLPSTHPGLGEGAHTLRVSCAEGDGQARGEATVPMSIGARPIVAELVPTAYVKWVGDDLLALEGAAHSVRLRVAEGHYSGARYDYRIAWGDGSADFAPARTSATALSATHRYAPVGAVTRGGEHRGQRPRSSHHPRRRPGGRACDLRPAGAVHPVSPLASLVRGDVGWR